MASAEDQAITQDSNEAALQEFEAGLRRSFKQATLAYESLSRPKKSS